MKQRKQTIFSFLLLSVRIGSLDFYFGFNDCHRYDIWISSRTLHVHCAIIIVELSLRHGSTQKTETDHELSLVLTAWETIRLLHREIPAQAVTVLLYVASHNPCHKQAIEEDQNLTTASCSRMIDFLNKGYGRKGVLTRDLVLLRSTRIRAMHAERCAG